MPARRGTVAQRGWAALIALLIALAIVAVLAGGLLRQYGLGGSPSRSAKPGEATTAEQLGGVAPAVPEPAAVAPRDAIPRARSVEGMVKQQAIDLDKRIDEQTR